MSKGWVGGLGLVVVASFVTACGSGAAPEASDDAAVDWAASAEAEAALGVHEWHVEGTPERAVLTGVSADGATVFHTVVDRSVDRIAVDLDKPDVWHLDYERGALPVASGPIPPGVSVAFAASEQQAASRADGAGSLTGRSLHVNSDGVSGSPREIVTPQNCPLVTAKHVQDLMLGVVVAVKLQKAVDGCTDARRTCDDAAGDCDAHYDQCIDDIKSWCGSNGSQQPSSK